MATRRMVLIQSLRTAAAAAALHACRPLEMFAGERRQSNAAPGQTSPHAPDEMTVNSAPQPQHYPQPDFGPPQATLPPEAKAVSGRHSLAAHARRHGLVAGAAVVVRVLEGDPVLQQLAAEQYGMLVPEAELKWRALRPAQDRFDFTASDTLLAYTAAHHMQLRGHTLVWHNSVPDWLSENAAHLDVRQLLTDHITTVCAHYAGKVHSWDVVNEAIFPQDGQPNGLRKSFWYEHAGPDYIDLAFRTARAADPHALLTYNDYGVEYDNADQSERRRLVLELLRGLKSRGVPLDAVGIQSHIKAGSPDTIGKGLTDFMEGVRQMGLQIFLTEMDVNEDDLAFDDIARRDGAIAKTYADYLQIALANPAVKAMLTWGISDRRTWLNDGPTHHRKQPNRPQRSLPFDAAYRPAPAFFAIRDAFDRRT